MGLAGKRILVVGASSGIGRALAHASVAAGAQVALCARRADRLQAAIDEAGGLFRHWTAHAFMTRDLMEASDLGRLLAETLGTCLAHPGIAVQDLRIEPPGPTLLSVENPVASAPANDNAPARDRGGPRDTGLRRRPAR